MGEVESPTKRGSLVAYEALYVTGLIALKFKSATGRPLQHKEIPALPGTPELRGVERGRSRESASGD